MEKIRIAKYMIIIGAIMFLSGGGLFFINKDKYFKEDSPVNSDSSKEVASQTTQIQPFRVEDYNGVYQKDNYSIKLYGINNRLDFHIIGESVERHEMIDIWNNSFSINDFCSVVMNSNTLNLTCNDTNVTGTYTRFNKYDMIDYYTDNVGNPNFVNTKYFGEYQNDNFIVTMYQTSETEVYVGFKGVNERSGISYEFSSVIDGDNIIVDENGSNITLSINEEGVLVVTGTNDFDLLSGSFVKLRVLTIESVIELKLTK